MDTLSANLRYVDASRLDTSFGRLGEVTVLTPARKALGTLEGVVVDLDWRRVCYLVVAARRWFMSRRYLVPLTSARFTDDGHALQVDVDDDELRPLSTEATPAPDLFQSGVRDDLTERSQAA
jgi:hypothetical protein